MSEKKIENRNKGRRGLPGAPPLCSPAAAGRPSQQAAQPASSSAVFPPSRQAAACRRARTPPTTPPPSLPACLSPPRLDAPDDATQPPRPPRTLPRPRPLLFHSLSLTAERHRRHRSPLPRPPASSRPPPLPRSSASSSASSSTSQVTRDAPHRRHRRLLHRRPPWIPIAAPPSPVRPRARFDGRCNRGELRHRFPLRLVTRTP